MGFIVKLVQVVVIIEKVLVALMSKAFGWNRLEILKIKMQQREIMSGVTLLSYEFLRCLQRVFVATYYSYRFQKYIFQFENNLTNY